MTEKRKLVARIVVVSLIVIIAAGLIVGDVYASRYAPIISSFLGCAEQLEGDTTKINEAAKTSDELVRKLADEGVVLLKNERDADGKPCLPLSKNKKEINIFGWGATDYGFLLTGNGSGKSLVSDELKVTLLKACTDSGITYNREIIGLYEKHRKPFPYDAERTRHEQCVHRRRNRASKGIFRYGGCRAFQIQRRIFTRIGRAGKIRAAYGYKQKFQRDFHGRGNSFEDVLRKLR